MNFPHNLRSKEVAQSQPSTCVLGEGKDCERVARSTHTGRPLREVGARRGPARTAYQVRHAFVRVVKATTISLTDRAAVSALRGKGKQRNGLEEEHRKLTAPWRVGILPKMGI